MKDEIVRALLAEMREKLMAARPETRRANDASILLLSGIMATFTAEPAWPDPFREKTYS